MKDENIWKKYKRIEILYGDCILIKIKGFDKNKKQYVIINEMRKHLINKEAIFMKIEDFTKSYNINKILEIIENGNLFYVVEEWNLTLEDLIKKKEVPSINKIKEIFIQINNAFKIFIEKKIILKEIIPSNIFINENSLSQELTIKISPTILFNVLNLKYIEEDYIYSPLTVAPEVLNAPEIMNESSSIWSLGIILYLLLFNEYPFKGNSIAQFFKEMISKKQLKEPDDKDLKDLLNKMLIVNIKERISWNDYINHPFFKNNISKDNNLLYDNSLLNKMAFQINKLYEDNLNFEIIKIGYETKIKQYVEKIKILEEVSINDKNKVKIYEEKIKKLEEENKNDKNKIKFLEVEIEKDKTNLNEIKKESQKNKEKIKQIEKDYNQINKNLINMTKNYQEIKRKYEAK